MVWRAVGQAGPSHGGDGADGPQRSGFEHDRRQDVSEICQLSAGGGVARGVGSFASAIHVPVRRA
eukprot:10007724-Lingulodinium_polyedra.AAC.1